jgi:hypothetical protein
MFRFERREQRQAVADIDGELGDATAEQCHDSIAPTA